MSTTELHRHLDACFRPKTLLDFIKRFKIESDLKTEDDVKRDFWVTKPMPSLSAVLNCFVLFQKCFQATDVLTRITKEAIEDAKKEGIKKLELRYSPSFVSELSDLPWGQTLGAIQAGLKGKGDMQVGLIGIVSRDYGAELATKTVEFVLANREDFIGIDLAGNEVDHPAKKFEWAFRKATLSKLPITAHAGEATAGTLKQSVRNIWEAIDILGAKRIGHAVAATEDKALLQRMARDQILIESCPTSNLMTAAVSDWKQHPLPAFLEAGIPVAICTDDPGIFGVTLAEEYNRAKTKIGLSDKHLNKIAEMADKHSFLKV